MKRKAGSYPTPQRTPKIRRTLFPTNTAASASRRAAKGAALRAVGRGIAKAVPYVDAAQTLYSAGKYVYNRFKGKKVYRGATISKSAGRFKRPTKITTLSDRFIGNGIVMKFEHGGVQTSQRQVVYIAHHTLPPFAVGSTVCLAMLKKLFTDAKFHIKNDEELLLNGAYYDGIVRLDYKTKDGNALQSQDFTVTAASTTLESLANAVMLWFQGLFSSGHSYQMLILRFYMQYGTLTNALDLKSEMDLTNAYVDIFGKSIMKVQNRTVNSTGNDQADDVDNVPLQGRIYEYKSNGTVYRDFNRPTAADVSMITTHNSVGCLPGPGAYSLPSETDTQFYKELPDRTQFVGCYKMAPTSLDPGYIKTSQIVDKINMSFTKLFPLIWGQSQSNANGTSQFWLGHSQLMGFEKKINAVAMTTENQFNVAYEKQGEVGVIFKVKKSIQTAPVIMPNTYQT
jgi:hypothetical protein